MLPFAVNKDDHCHFIKCLAIFLINCGQCGEWLGFCPIPCIYTYTHLNKQKNATVTIYTNI